MIVRLMGDAQYQVEDSWLARLNGHDDRATEAIDTSDTAALERELGNIWELVRQHGTRLADDDLSPSDAIVPPLDLSLAEARELMGNDGFIPDLPA
jgi:hypothetical protein